MTNNHFSLVSITIQYFVLLMMTNYHFFSLVSTTSIQYNYDQR